MFRKLFAVVTLAMAGVAFAGQTAIDTSGLTDAQIAELKAHAAKVVADAAKGVEAPATTKEVGAMVTLAATWGQQAAAAAEGFARALSLAARELGVTVNDFLHTDAGKLTAILIIWKVAGASLAKMLFGLLVVLVGSIVARVVYKRLFTKEYVQVPYEYLWGMFKGTKMVRVPKGFAELRNDGEWLAFFVMIIVIVLSLFIGGALIT